MIDKVLKVVYTHTVWVCALQLKGKLVEVRIQQTANTIIYVF